MFDSVVQIWHADNTVYSYIAMTSAHNVSSSDIPVTETQTEYWKDRYQ